MTKAGVSLDQNSPKQGRRRLFGQQVPTEGDNGLYTQSWFPICLASEISMGTVKGFPFLGGRVIAFRGDDGIAQVTSAYCAHLGADLSVGKVVGNRIQCAYHLWEYDRGGACRKTGCGDPAPARATLFAFPTQEKHGLIWAYNGEEPHYDLPEWPIANKDLIVDAQEFPVPMNVDPWVVCAQTPDIQHVLLLHKFDMQGPNPAESVEWSETGLAYDMDGIWGGRRMTIRVAIIGTSIFFQTGTLDGRWFGFMTTFASIAPGQCKLFAILAAERAEDEAEVRAFIEDARQFETAIAMEDAELGQTIHFKVGALTRQDAPLARYLDFVRNFPRAHPSAEFID